MTRPTDPLPPTPRPDLRARVLACELRLCAEDPPRDLTALRARLAAAWSALATESVARRPPRDADRERRTP